MDRINYLLQQYWEDRSTREELSELLVYFNRGEEESQLVTLLWERWQAVESAPETDQIDWPGMLSRIAPVKNSRHPFYRLLWFRLAAAILFPLAVLACGVWLLNRQKNEKPVTEKISGEKQHLALAGADIAPGGNRATLSLDDGRLIILDSLSTGELLSESGAKVLKEKEGLLRYESNSDATDVVGYNTITTPRGGEYRVMLPDGSQVWLNAASSLRFSTRFTGKERLVELTGEGYFEIKPDKTRPFIALVNGSRIEVTGTHFNVMAYGDEPALRTTLLEGGVKVISKYGKDSVVIVPGQQAVDHANRPMRKVIADVEAAVAWKNGITSFQNTSLAGVLRSLSRWYDIDITYENGIPQQTFTGGISRYAQLSEVLDMLRYAGLRFRMSGRTLIVSQ